ncbi:RING finger protein nhl-1-like isoform X3 [Vespa mandarinia]|uniref:RING finger protein nhl-1-like isoform X3 n=1 Tax=Vespa mandarinia TaxID=7446 RepID=UPI00161C4DFC|nr:RING finger protein nhl-1-like isoform X3 [Vespa mandarinia]
MEQFEQLLTCAICLDRYRNPKLLPCQHSFCMEPCMDGLVDYVRRQVKCPECRAEHRIPYQGVQAFPTNVTLQRFLELHIEITGELPDPTSGQTMERCGVCSEKSYCSLCVHCEKKCCPECKDAHMDILRREITRINSQVRRGLHRLQDALALVEKNTLGLQTNCAAVAEEVDEIYRRLSKALKDRTEYLRNEVDRYLGTELRGLIQLKENLELEIANIQSNCDLAEAHINENVPWDDSELLDTKELFLRTVEFIRNFEYEAGDYSRRVRFMMAHDPNQLVLHVAGYGELNIKPESGTGGLLGSSSSLAPPGGSPGLMRSKSDHRLASQYRQQEEERLARNRYVPEYEYEAPEYDAPRNKSRYRSRFMRHRDGDDSDGDSRSTVRFTSTPQESGLRERVLDTEDAARGPLSGIFRLTDSPRVMKKLQECERAGKRKKEESAQPAQPQTPKPQVQVRIAPTAMARQVSEDDEISRIKKQNKNAAQPTVETVEERQPQPPTAAAHPQAREQPQTEREAEEAAVRRPPTIARRTSTDTHAPATRSASSDSSTGSESSTGSGIRSTGAPFTAEEMKQKYLSRAPPTNTTTSTVTASSGRDSTASSVPASRPFQSRFLGTGNRAAPPPPTTTQPSREETTTTKKKEDDEEDDEEETSSSSEETESETEEESETDTHTTPTTSTIPSSIPQDRQRNDAAMARTDIGALLARSAEARRGSKEDSPSTRYSTSRGSPAHIVTSPTSPLTMTTTSGSMMTGSGAGSGVPISSTGGYSSSSITDRRLEGSNHEAGEHQREDVVIDGRKVNGSTTVSEKLEDEKKREYKTDKDEEDEEDEEEEEEEEEDDSEKADGHLKDEEEEEESLAGDESTSDSMEDEDEKTVISVHKGSDSERTARSSSLLSDRSNGDDLFDDNGWLVTDQDLQTDGSTRSSKNQESNSFEVEDDRMIEKASATIEETKREDILNSTKIPESSFRSRVYRQSSIGKNGWLISDESESESERAISPAGSTKNTDNVRNEEDVEITEEEDTKGSVESKKDNWSIEENGWMIVNEDESTGSIPNLSGYKDPSSSPEKTELKRGRSSTIRSQTTTDLVTRANVENGALIANANRTKETERSDEHEDATDVDISIPMQMVTTVFCVSVLCYSVLMNLFL